MSSGTSQASITPSDVRTGDRKRAVFASAFWAGGVLLLVSAYVAWWSLTSGSATTSFLPGTSLRTSGAGGSFSVSYTNAAYGFGAVGDIYLAIWILAVAAGILALAGGAVGLLHATGSVRKNLTRFVPALVITVIVLNLVALVVGPVAQPWAVSRATGYSSSCTGFEGGTSPCTTFWGSDSLMGVGTFWGPTTGWYLALVALALMLGGGLLWRLWRT